MMKDTSTATLGALGPALDRGRADAWVLGSNSNVWQVAEYAQRVARHECTCLIRGETGTGKELWAQLIHQSGPRKNRALIPVNCAALTASLAEAQLFGHERGAFTGALGSSLGVFRAAEGGVVFLDEIGEMPLDLQPKLLRVLQEREVTPVGASRPVPVDVQVIAATNRNLDAEVLAGTFREDLFYRLNMVQLDVPPLRERVEDIPEFVEFFARLFAGRYGRDRWRPDAAELSQFCTHPWPGNIRQLAQTIEQSYVLDCRPALPAAPRPASGGTRLPFLNLQRLRDESVRQALRITRGHKGRAAELLGVHPNTLTRLVQRLDGPHDGEE